MKERFQKLLSLPRRQLLSIVFMVAVLGLGVASTLVVRQQKPILQPVAADTIETPESSPSPTPSPTPDHSGKILPITADQKIPILMYHYIRNHTDQTDKVGAGLSVSPAIFAKQLADLKAAGYTTITFKDLAKPLPAKPIILTFDDGYDDAYTEALPALQKEGMTGVFYIVSDFLNRPQYTTTDQVKVLDAAGMEIGSHTINHKDLAKMGENDQEKQLTTSKAALENLLGKSVTSFCYPAGKYNAITVTLAKKAGYTTSTTTKPGIATGQDFMNSPHELKRIRVTESTDLLKALGEKR